ncbi:MAG: hypothetical protein ACI943_000129 [Gammaproteobacteria bacterium]|jgi:hypothetical protein
MKKLYRSLLLIGAFVTYCFSNANGQCDVDQTEIQFIMHTDAWGYENYWEVVNNGDPCGENTIAWGGNDLDVGCSGTGDAGATGEDIYGNNLTIIPDAFCAENGQLIDLHFIDSYGDGGLVIEVLQDGILTGVYYGTETGNVWIIDVGNTESVDYNQPCQALPVEIDNGSYMLNSTGAFAAYNEISPGGGNCAVYGVWCEGAVTNSVWASFIAPEEGAIEISTCNEGTTPDTQLALYSGNDCSEMANFTLVTANDDAIGGCIGANGYSATMYASCLVPGDEYFIQIDGWNGSAGEIFLSVSSYEGSVSLGASVNAVNCPVNKGEAGTGSIMPYVTGWGSNFTTTWTGPGNFESDENFIYDLNGGEYTAVLTDACGGETLTETFFIDEPDYFYGSYDVVSIECPLSGDGSITLDLSGGSAPYEYFWTGPEDFQMNSQNLENLNLGVYSVYVEDENGCVYEHDVNVQLSDEFTFDLGDNVTICDDEDVLIYGPAGYLYTWQDGNENQFFEVDGAQLGAGTYSYILTAYNEEGCTHTDAIIVTVWNCTAVGEIDGNSPTLFPNPSNGAFTIDGMQTFSKGNIEVVDIAGKTIFSSQLSNNVGGRAEFEIQAESGLYLVRVKLDETLFSYSMVIE